MKKVVLPLVCGLFVLAIGIGGSACGGGGSGGSNGNSGNPGGSTGLTNIRAEAALAGAPTAPIDATNIQAGEAIVFEVAGYDSSNVRHIIASSNWTTNDNGNQVGVLQADGNFSATNASSSSFLATGTANSKNYSVTYRVRPVQAMLTGTIKDNNGLPASDVNIVFFNAGGTIVGRGIAQYDGSFRASVPTTALTFSLDKATIPTTKYYRSFKFNGKRYTPLISSCRAPLPALVNGTSTVLGTVTLDATKTGGIPNPPPPPPDGCS